VLLTDGQRVYMRHIAFDDRLRQMDEPLATNWPGSPKYWDDPVRRNAALFPLSYHVVDYGRRVYSTMGLLDDSWHNRQFWAYGRVVGQSLVFRGNRAWAVKAYPSATRWTRFNAGDGYLVYLGDNANPPNDEAVRAELRRVKLQHPLFPGNREVPLALRQDQFTWSVRVPLRPVAMVLAGETLWLAGPPDLKDPAEATAALEGKKGALLWALSASDGTKLAELKLDAPPVFDGMAAAGGSLYISLKDGSVLCLGSP